jgi:rRNA maturation endonuclease Nob1
MALMENKYVVLSDGAFAKTPKQSWLETLRRWVVRCPKCAEARLVVGARENDFYTCKDCGHRFAITLSVAENELSTRGSNSK